MHCITRKCAQNDHCCRRAVKLHSFIHSFENTFVVWKDRKHRRKRRKCWLPALSPFPMMFSKAVFLRLVKRRIYNINIYHGKELKDKKHGSGWCTFKPPLVKHIYFILMLRCSIGCQRVL